MREVHTTLLVIGAGPAGIAAAVVAAERGASVQLLDMQPRAGGQIWRGQSRDPVDAQARAWLRRLRESTVRCEFDARLIAAPAAGVALATTPQGPLRILYTKVVIATGARELLLPFPGWTLPRVCGAGGLQVLAKDGLDVRGKRVVVAGSGPLLLAVASSLRQRGARVLCIAEQAGWRARLGVVPTLLGSPRRLLQACGYAWSLRGVPNHANAWPLRAEGDDVLKKVIVRIGARERSFDCDYLAVGFGLLPNLDVAAAFGCAIEQGAVRVDTDQATSVPGVYCVGEGTGIGGVEQALAQGAIAGHAVSGVAAPAALRRRRDAARRGARELLRHTAPRAELRELADPDTLVCRCENVSLAALRDCRSAREARLHRRFGMGHCQGRICAPVAQFLRGWPAEPPRAPRATLTMSHVNLSTLSQPQETNPT